MVEQNDEDEQDSALDGRYGKESIEPRAVT